MEIWLDCVGEIKGKNEFTAVNLIKGSILHIKLIIKKLSLTISHLASHYN